MEEGHHISHMRAYAAGMTDDRKQISLKFPLAYLEAADKEADEQGCSRQDLMFKALKFYLACVHRGLRGQAFTIITEDGEKIEVSAKQG